MGTTTTPNLSLIKPDLSEPIPNWATQNESNCDTIDAFFSYTETDYSPTWTGTGGNPSLGSGGSISGRWASLWPKLIRVEIQIDCGGAGFDAGSGVYELTTPSTMNAVMDASESAVRGFIIGTAICIDINSNSNSCTMAVRARSSTTIGGILELGATGGSTWGNSSPFSWAQDDRISLYFVYLEA